MSRPRHELLPQGVEPLALRQGAMAAALSLSETTFKEMQEQGLLPAMRVFRGVKLGIVEEFKAALYSLPVDTEDEPVLMQSTRRIK